MALPSFMTSGRSTVVVRIYSYQEKCPNGTLQGLHFNSPVEFSSLTQMLLLMEEMLDRVNGPQRGESPSAIQKTEAQPQFAVRDARKPLATFQLSVLFRQNASWQGTLIWTDRMMDSQFRSVLELVRLMDSALTADPE